VARISSSTALGTLTGGSEQLESPECTPASSMCSMMPAITQSVPSATASTSNSVALGRNSSTSTGWSGDARTASRM
jgi:hypothetical protein